MPTASAATAGKAQTSGALRHALSGQRVVNGTFVAALGIASIWLAPVFATLVVFIALVGVYEFANLVRRAGAGFVLPVALLGAALYVALAYFQLLGRFETFLLGAILIASATAAIAYGVERYINTCALSVFAALYLGKLLSYFVLLRNGHNGLALTLWVVVIVALTDIVGMVAGLRYGRAPLAPQLSPAKTWEGALSAFIVATAAGTALAMTTYISAPWWTAALCAASISIAAQIGDLIESALKRSAHVKDSGHIIAGHGGILDRFDSYIVAGFVAYAVLRTAGLA